MKKLTLLSLAFILLLSFAACGAPAYKNDVATADIASAVDAKLSGAATLVTADELYLTSFNPEYITLVCEYTVKYTSSGASFDEYGIFKVENAADTEKIVTMLNEFKQYRIDADLGYLPAELPKIKDAKIVTYGNYVMYAFLSAEEADAAFAEFEKALIK